MSIVCLNRGARGFVVRMVKSDLTLDHFHVNLFLPLLFCNCHPARPLVTAINIGSIQV